MKTEKEFSQIFIDSCACDDRNRLFVEELAAQYWTDLTAHLNSYFSNSDRILITQKAGQALGFGLKEKTPDEAWKTVIRDFTSSGYWGFTRQPDKPIAKKSEEQKIFWKFFKYAWALFQAMILMKIAVLFFGIKAAENPNEISQIWVWVAFALSMGSLGLFVYRNRSERD